MEFIGKCAGINHNMLTGKCTITFEIDAPSQQVVDAYNDIKDVEKLKVDARKYRRKRSLDANAYAWVLMTKMAGVLRTSKDEVYELMLQRYPNIDMYDDECIVATFKSTVDISMIDGHWIRYKSNGTFTSYIKIKGSSKFDSKEMSVFIDGIISECKELGIETLTPNEIERLKQEWHINTKTA